jgi:hypothetical protein
VKRTNTQAGFGSKAGFGSEVYRPGEGIELFSFKNEKQVERATRGLILLIQGSAFPGKTYM